MKEVEAMSYETEEVKGRLHRRPEMPRGLDVHSGDEEPRRFDLKTSAPEGHTFVSRDLLGQFEGKFLEHMRGLENNIEAVKSELGKLSEFREHVNGSLGQLTLKVNENKLGLEHVAKDVELERFRGEFEKTRRELELRVAEDFKQAKNDIDTMFHDKTRTTLAWLAAVSGIIAIIVSALIQLLK